MKLAHVRGSLGRVAVVVAVLAWAGCSPDQTPTGPGGQSPSFSVGGQQQGLATAMAAQERHNPELLRTGGVEGTAVGLTADGRPAVLIFTRSATVGGLPQTLEGVPVSVEVTGPFTALMVQGNGHGKPGGGGGGGGGGNVDPTTRFGRPVPIGVSTGNAGECSAGTISARVKSGNSVYALSNNHVYALENAAPIGSEVLQPGLYDTNCSYSSTNHLGNLSQYVRINFSGTNTVDAAIASTTTADLDNATPSNGYGTPSSTAVSAALNMAVQKYGRTTSLTRGTITAINATVNVGYSSGTALFVNQIVVHSRRGAFIKAGDSGSLLVTDNSAVNPVGLLFAGDQTGKYGIANQIGDVLQALGVTIDGK